MLGFGAVKQASNSVRTLDQPLASNFGFTGWRISCRCSRPHRRPPAANAHRDHRWRVDGIGHFMMAFETLFRCPLDAHSRYRRVQAEHLDRVGALTRPATIAATARVRSSISASISGRFGAAGLRHPRRQFGWHAGFGAAGVGMLVSLGIYLGGQRTLPRMHCRRRRPSPLKKPLDSGERRALTLIGVCALVTYWAATISRETRSARRKISPTVRSISCSGEARSLDLVPRLEPAHDFIFTPLIVRWAREITRH